MEAFIDESSQSLCLVMEFANDGDLLQKIEKADKTGEIIDEDTVIWPVFISVVKALS